MVIAAHNHAFILDEKAGVWALGINDHGVLGVETIRKLTNPIKIKFPKECNITKIIALKCSSMALDDEGHVWAWGINHHGEVGAGHKAK